MAKNFIVTEDHLKLLSKAYVGWNDCEYGAPEIDPKRPYGNSSPEYDIMEILGEDFEGFEDGDDEPDFTPEQLIRCRKIHEETQTVLQIILSTRTMEAGTYMRENEYGSKWRKL